mmetsp:Transcript_46478/g.92065  ORF Transcript_46478/g.92065 Transcript_46478/m.92065 type:complete len:566 (-) Transcript_46478:10-1707(-)
MAYYRPSMLSASLSEQNGNANISKPDRESVEDKSKEEKPLTLFSIDLSGLSPTVQYILLASGLILFMCLYGYYQELVIYGWFDRKLSIFSTFLHFLGCFSFAQIQRYLSKSSKPSTGSTGCAIQASGYSYIPVFSLGTAPPRVAIFYYVLLILVRTGAQGMSNLSMTQINYPAKVLFKSASPIVTMIIGIFWFRKSYPVRDYIVVALLVFGLYVFITGDHSSSPESTRLGIFYVTVSLFGSAGIPMIQEHCMVTYNSSIEDLLYHTFMGSAIASFLMSCITGEFVQGVMFLVRTGSLHAWFIMFAFTIFGFVGTNFSAALTLQYGSLVNGITNTFRKALTLGLSFFLFPERNIMTHQKLLGSLIFFCGLLVRIFSKEKKEGKSHKDHSDKKEIDVESGVLRAERSIIDTHTDARTPSLSIHTAYYGNNGSTDFGQILTTDVPISSSESMYESRQGEDEEGGIGEYYIASPSPPARRDSRSDTYTPSWRLSGLPRGATMPIDRNDSLKVEGTKPSKSWFHSSGGNSSGSGGNNSNHNHNSNGVSTRHTEEEDAAQSHRDSVEALSV